MENSCFEKIYDVVKQIPYGQVATYGQIAALAGNKRWARVVGYALHVNPDPNGIPCFRVVNREGRVSPAFAFGGGNRQIELLLGEKVGFVGIDGMRIDDMAGFERYVKKASPKLFARLHEKEKNKFEKVGEGFVQDSIDIEVLEDLLHVDLKKYQWEAFYE